MKRIEVIILLLHLNFIAVFGIGIPPNVSFIVAKDSSGNFTTIQAAINAAPDNSTERTLIYIKNGIYEESITVSSRKTNVVLYGESSIGVLITYMPEESTDLSTLEVEGEGFIGYNLTIENTAGPSWGPAEALVQEGDKSIYINCRIIANQDTYYNRTVRSFMKNCYIEGTVDFIYGDGTVVFEDCDLYSKGGSAITAASTKDYVDFGYVFRNCRVVCKNGTTTHLGRPWRDYAAVAFINCELPDEIVNSGWHNWDKPERETTSRYAEYMNFGPGADTSYRVSWVKMLSAEEAEAYTTLNVLKTTYSTSRSTDNWNPYNEIENAGIRGLNNDGDGFGMNEGGTGGTTVTVNNETDFRSYATSNDKYIIRVSGNIALSGRVDIGSNTTITGINEESGFSVATLNLADENKNIIIKNLNISNPNGDGISVWNGHSIFISHVSFYDCGDGCCDINRGADSVTVSWCKFYYPTQTEHRFTMIADGAMTWNDQGDVISYENKLHLTLHHNWWYIGSDQRMPASTNTRAHIYNNYWNCVNNSYCSNARRLTEFYSENNYYDNVNNPSYQESDGLIYSNGNVYNECNGEVSSGTDSVFAPGYSYLLTDADIVPQVVTARAGNVWEDAEKYIITVTSDRYGKVSNSGTHAYNKGRLVTFEAVPYNDNYKFSGWSGYNSSSNPLIFYVDADYEILATFCSTADSKILFEDYKNVVYPNPTTDGNFFVDLDSSESGIVSVSICNLNGAMVFYEDCCHESGIIYVQSDLKKGLYVIDINTNENRIKRKIIVY